MIQPGLIIVNKYLTINVKYLTNVIKKRNALKRCQKTRKMAQESVFTLFWLWERGHNYESIQIAISPDRG